MIVADTAFMKRCHAPNVAVLFKEYRLLDVDELIREENQHHFVCADKIV